MKKILCFIFIILSGFVNCFFDSKTLTLCDVFVNPISIKIISNDCDESSDFVHNGNNVIKKLYNLREINESNLLGITIILNKDFDIYDFINQIKLNIDRSYNINSDKILEGKFYVKLDIPFQTIQIAIKNDYVVVGFPMILDSF